MKKVMMCLMLLVMTSISYAEKFTKVPLWGGEISMITMCYSSPTVLYAGSSYSGTYVSTDAGATWTATKPTTIIGQSSDKLAVHSSQPNIVIAKNFGSNVALVRSENYGKTWTQTGTEIQGVVVDIVPSIKNPGTFYLLGKTSQDGVLYKSTDSAQTWTKTAFTTYFSTESKNPHLLKVDIDDNIFISVKDEQINTNTGGVPTPGGSGWLYRSTDCATNWSIVDNSWQTSLAVASGTVVYGNYTSTNSGQSFLQTPVIPGTISLSPDGKKIYVFCSSSYGDGCYVSSYTGPGTGWMNHGWSDIVKLSSPVVNASSMVIDPANPDTMYISDTFELGCLKSIDGGVTWQASNVGLAGMIIENGCEDPLKNKFVLSGIAVYRSTDNCNSFQRKFSPVTSGGPFYLGEGGLDGGIITAPTTNYVFVGGGGKLYRSTDGGETFSVVFSTVSVGAPPSFFRISDIVFNLSNPAIGYFGTYERVPANNTQQLKYIYKTTDHGATWSAINFTHYGCQALAIDPNNPNVIYAGIGNKPFSMFSNWAYGGIYRIVDDSGSITSSLLGFSDLVVYKILVSPDGTLMAACMKQDTSTSMGSSGKTYYLENGSDTWHEINYQASMYMTGDIKYSEGAYYVSSQHQVLASTTSPSQPFELIATNEELGTIRCLVMGSMYSGANKGFYKLNYVPSSARTSTGTITSPETGTKVYNFKNPFNPKNNETTIRYIYTYKPNKVTVKIYTLSGDLVWEQEDSTIDGSITWNGKNNNGNLCASGIYFVVVDMDGTKAKNKIVLVY